AVGVRGPERVEARRVGLRARAVVVLEPARSPRGEVTMRRRVVREHEVAHAELVSAVDRARADHATARVGGPGMDVDGRRVEVALPEIVHGERGPSTGVRELRHRADEREVRTGEFALDRGWSGA